MSVRPFLPAAQLDQDYVTWLNHEDVRGQIETVMAVFDCEAWQAVLIRQAVQQASYLQDLVDEVRQLREAEEEPPGSWGEGANPSNNGGDGD